MACWDPNRYDLFIPMHKTTISQVIALIAETIVSSVLQSTDTSRQRQKDFLLTANIEVALAAEGHHADVAADGPYVTLSLHKQVLLQERLEEELRSIAGSVTGVESVAINACQNNDQAPLYRKHDLSIPSKVLLVDDERDFVQTLSQRLQMREMGSAVVYDGASALRLIHSDDPEVMIIDLKMPGINGMEVLQKVKKERPEIEVIILTGKGSQADEEQCMKLGAFGFLQKPVDIEKLSDMLKKAHAKIQRRPHQRKQK
jgi:CheY-like chemotaxis protein